jgi:hypothetical protein
VSRFIDVCRGRFGVEPICRTLDVSASAFYQRATGRRSARAVGDERLLERIERVHAANYHCYGYRRTWLALKREGVEVGRDRVKRLMRANRIEGAKRRGKPWRTTIADPAAARRPDLVQRDFTASCPDALWVADFTYLRCWEGLVFFAFVLDVYSRRVVGWQLAGHMRQTSSWTRSEWRSRAAERAPTCGWCTTPMPAANTPATRSGRSSTTTACSARSARSATRSTTPWPRASSTPSRPS